MENKFEQFSFNNNYNFFYSSLKKPTTSALNIRIYVKINTVWMIARVLLTNMAKNLLVSGV